jgi:hypothetical protein
MTEHSTSHQAGAVPAVRQVAPQRPVVDGAARCSGKLLLIVLLKFAVPTHMGGSQFRVYENRSKMERAS